ncbi:hypothetical protein V6N13_059764 [Hibiscus sabdariffa]
MNNGFSAGCSLKSVAYEEYNPSLLIEDEKEIYGSLEASSNNMDYTSVRPPPDGGALTEEIRFLTNFTCKEVQDIVTAAEARRRKEFIKLKNLQDGWAIRVVELAKA